MTSSKSKLISAMCEVGKGRKYEWSLKQGKTGTYDKQPRVVMVMVMGKIYPLMTHHLREHGNVWIKQNTGHGERVISGMSANLY